jgi:putative PIN family toxin of toxin-antitoxin system
MGAQKITQRIVLDTNVIISALLFGGETARVIEKITRNKYEVLISRAVLNEYIRVLAYPKFKLSEDDIRFIIEEIIIPLTTPIEVTTRCTILKNDPDDNKFLALAIDGKADLLISGDTHLLTLKKYKSIPIITVAEFCV